MFKCIKEITINNGRVVCFQKDKSYDSHHFNDTTGHEVTDDTGTPHIIGHEGEEWFDEHFIDSVEDMYNEKYYNDTIEAYKDMSNNDEIETKALQDDIKKRVEDAVAPYKAFYDYFKELYGTGLDVANWHLNGELEPFDEFFESAEHEMNKEVMVIERKKEIADSYNKARDLNDAALRRLSDN